MTSQIRRKYSAVVFWFSFVVAAISFAALLALLGMEAYIRWSLNQDFGFLSGFGSGALIFSVFALIVVLAYIYHPTDSE